MLDKRFFVTNFKRFDGGSKTEEVRKKKIAFEIVFKKLFCSICNPSFNLFITAETARKFYVSDSSPAESKTVSIATKNCN